MTGRRTPKWKGPLVEYLLIFIGCKKIALLAQEMHVPYVKSILLTVGTGTISRQ
jgi:hypothetical protein